MKLDGLLSWLAVPSPAGYESALMERVVAHARGLGLPVERDALGNAWVRVGPEEAPISLLLVAPLDEPGLVVSHVDEEGLARVTPLRVETRPHGRVPARVRSVQGATGALRWKPTADPANGWEGVYLEAWQGAFRVGDVLAWDTPPAGHEDAGLLVGRGLHRALAWMMLEVLARFSPKKVRVYGLLAVREGVPTHGAALAAWRLAPQAALMLRTFPAREPEAPAEHPRLGGGPVLLLREPGWVAHPAWVQVLQATAPEDHQAVVLPQGPRGGHPLPWVQAGLPTAALGLACRGQDTPFEALMLEDGRRLQAWLEAVLARIDADFPFST